MGSAQDTSLILIPKLTAFVSMSMSILILQAVIRQYGKTNKKTYHRFMAILACLDIGLSLACSMGTWPIPAGEATWAIGNNATCWVQGATIQFAGVTSFCYQWCLSLYYLLIIRYGWTERSIQSNVEPGLHVFSLFMGVSTTAIAGMLQAYNPATIWCWIGPREGVLGETLAFRLRWIVFYIIVWTSICLNAANSLLIYLYVRQLGQQQAFMQEIQQRVKEQLQSQQQKKDTAKGNGSSTTTINNETNMKTTEASAEAVSMRSSEYFPPTNASTCGSVAEPELKEHRDLILAATKRLVGNSAMSVHSRESTFNSASRHNNKNSTTNNTKDDDQEENDSLSTTSTNPIPKRKKPRRTKNHQRRPSGDNASVEFDFDVEAGNEQRKQQQQERELQQHRATKNKLDQIASQSFYYVLAFFLSWFSISVLRFTQAVTDATLPYWFILLAASTAPVQGVFNLLIFLRPKALRLRELNPKMPVFQTLWIALWQGHKPSVAYPQYQTAAATGRAKQEQAPTTQDATE